MMPVTDILIRSMSGYVFVLPEILLYFCYLKKTGRKQPPLHVISAFIFCYYLVGILTMTGIGRLKAFSPRIVPIPFRDMISGPVDTILNVILFLPLGFFLPLLYKKYDRVSKAALTGFLLSLSVELIQMFGRGGTDINDLITNTVGAGLGYLIFKLLAKRTGVRLREKFWANQVNDGVEILFFAVCSFVVMVTIQPLVIHSLFRLG